MPPENIAIVGAGLAGLACAKTLAAYGGQVRLFERDRVPGGRLASRRVDLDGTVLNFDYGAQYLTAHTPAFAAVLDATGAKEWPDAARRVGVPRMSAVPRALADGLEILQQRQVAAITGAPGAWMLHHKLNAQRLRPGRPVPPEPTETAGPFDAVVLAIPAPEAQALLVAPAPHLAAVLDVVRFAPCWTLMAAFPNRIALPDTVRLHGGPINWAARDSSKPKRDPETECWIAQAGPEWSREYADLAPDEAVAMLLQALARLTFGPLPQPIFAAAHFWPHALVEVPLGAPCLWDASTGFGATGDWCIGPRAEAAMDSAAALVAAMRST